MPLGPGLHKFQVQQSAAYPATTWTVTVSLAWAPAPEITVGLPATIDNRQPATLELTGANFQPDDNAVWIGNRPAGTITWVDAGKLVIDVNNHPAPGVFGLTVANPDGQSVYVAGAITITGKFYTFMPLVRR